MTARFWMPVLFAGWLALPMPGADAHEHGEAGKTSFPTSCDAKVQAQFETGVAMLHSYWFGQARKAFESVLQQDPGCAIAYWGIAVDLLGNTLSAPPAPKNAQAAWNALEKARAIGAKTQRERDWIESLSAYFRDHDKIPVEPRLLAYTHAMEKLTQRYPDDYEAWVFYALTLQASASPSDRTYANQLKSASILERLYEQNPQHPGVSHFLIHAYDYPPLAGKGLAAARRYAALAPAAPHARHMPSHIYSMLGMWEDSIASNQSSLEVQPAGFHQMDFIVYAQLQLGQDAQARRTIERAVEMFGTAAAGGGSFLGRHMAIAAMPARHALERGDWKAAASLRPASTAFPAADAITRFARGLGMARGGDVAGAKREVEAMRVLRDALAQANQSYWAERTDEQIYAVSAWIAHAEGARDQALKLMRAAADGEDASVKHVAMENRLYPMRELLAELLMEMKQAGAALREFETSIKESPNRYRALYGIALAAEAAGDRQKASEYFAKLIELSKNADSVRPELARAKAYLAQR